MHKEPRPPGPGHDVEALTEWRLRALQLGVAIFTLLLLLSLIGVVLR